MKNGFIKVASASPKVKVSDVDYNKEQIIECIKTAHDNGAKLIVMSELGLCAYTCGDLFYQSELIRKAEEALLEIAKKTARLDILSVIGLPVARGGKLYNGAAFVKDGSILGIAVKKNIPAKSKGFEQRYFSTMEGNSTVVIGGCEVPIGTKLMFEATENRDFCVSAEIGEDLWNVVPPSCEHTKNGAVVIANPTASSELAGVADYRRMLVGVQSAKTKCAYIFANASEGESTTDMVFSGHNMIYELGTLVAESEVFSQGITYADIDVERILADRRKDGFMPDNEDSEYRRIKFHTRMCDTKIERKFEAMPFIPQNKTELEKRCKEVFDIQWHGLRKRLLHIGAKTVTIGISGGLDSTLALLVTVKAFESLDLSPSGIIAVTLPCFGTSDRTYNNAKILIDEIGATFREINIKNAVSGHLSDIGADIENHDVTYENAQARERTQILMDIANMTGGIVVGTGDLSELALGFATYNGDHMSMYGVNASVPKTLIRHIVSYVADQSGEKLKKTLYDVVNTPVSPELLPPDSEGEIAQQTEDIVGPYELHDFFLYNMIRWGFSKQKLARMAENAFAEKYDRATIEKWLDIFVKRFYASQFKRSCLPDGIKTGIVSLSPRGDFVMPSDANRVE